MPSPFLGFAAGLTQGLPQGLMYANQLTANEQDIKLRQQQASVAGINALSGALRIADPAMRTYAIKTMMPALNMDPNSQQGQDFLTTIEKSQQDTLNNAAQMLSSAGIEGMTPQMIGNMLQNDPSTFWNMVVQAQYRKSAMGLMDDGSGGGGTTTQPAGDMGTGTTADAGVAPQAGGQPPEQGAAPAAGQPTQGGPGDQGGVGPQGAAGQPHPNVDNYTTARDLAKNKGYAGGFDGQGNTYFAGLDPVVDRYNTRMKAAALLPGEYGTKAFNYLKDQRDTYIQQKHFEYQQLMDNLNHQIALGHLGIDQANMVLARQRLAFDISKPMSPAGQAIWDANHGYQTSGGVVPAGSPALPTGPDATPGSVGSQGSVSPTGEVQQPVIKTNDIPAGSAPVMDLATFKAAGVPSNAELYKGPDGKLYMKLPTEGSLQGAADVNEAKQHADSIQGGLNMLSWLNDQYTKNPQNFGIKGTIKNTIQDVLSRGKDIGEMVPGFKDMVKGLPQPDFDPKLPKAEYMENVLAALVARESFQGGTMGAGYTQAYEDAKKGMAHFIGPDISAEEAGANIKNMTEFLTGQRDKYLKQANISQPNVKQTQSGGDSQYPVIQGKGAYAGAKFIPQAAIDLYKQKKVTKQDMENTFGKGAVDKVQ